MTPEAMDGVWFADLLGLPSGAVRDVRLQTIGEGAGMMSRLQRARLHIADGVDAPATLIIKSPAVNETNRQVAVQFRTYERESRFFRELAGQCLAHTPRVYHCDVDETQNFVIVMEDLEGYRLGDQVAGADLADTEVCMEQLALLHASFWDRTAGLDWIPGISGSFHADNMRLGVEHGWAQTLAVFGDVIPQRVIDMIGPFRAALPRLQEELYAQPRTVLHGDFRLENLFFGGPGQHPLVIVDWQGPLVGRGMDEVAFFLAQNAKTDVRRAHERAIVRRYTQRLEELGVQYDGDAAWADYRLAVLYNWCYVVVVSGTLDTSNAHSRAWMTEMVRRNALAIDELGCYDLL
jgi:aminoglycoside phosphotransferase (APT) family kinase protein